MGMNSRDRVFDEMAGVVSGDDNKDMTFRGIILMKPEPEVGSAAQKVFRIYEDKTPWVARDIQLLENSAAELQTDWKTLEVQETYTSLNTEESAFAASEISFSSNQPESDAEKITEFFKWDNAEKSETKKQYYQTIDYNDQNEPRIIGGFDGFKQNPNANNSVTSEKSCHISWNDHVECYRYPLETSTSTMEVRVTPNFTDNRPRIRSQPDFFHKNSTKNTYHQKQTGANTEPFREETKQYRKVCVPSHDNGYTPRKSSERFVKSEKLNVGKETTKRTVWNSQTEGSRWHNDDQSRPNVPHGDTNSKPSDFGFDLNKSTQPEIYYHEDSFISCYNDTNNDCNYCDAYDTKKSVSEPENEKDPTNFQKEYLLAGEEKFTENCPVQKKDSVDYRTCGCSHQEQPVVKESNNQNKTNKHVLSDKRKRTLRRLLGLDATDNTDVLVMLKI